MNMRLLIYMLVGVVGILSIGTFSALVLTPLIGNFATVFSMAAGGVLGFVLSNKYLNGVIA